MLKTPIYLFIAAAFLSCQSQDNKSSILSPSKAIEDFEIEEGFQIDCVASEPDVEDPVAIAFDGAYKMYVVEMRSYMPDADGLHEDVPDGRIKLLEDKDHDGRFETLKIFIDSLVMPRAVCPVYDGVLVAVPPYLYFYNQDGKNAVVVDSAYADGGNVEHQANGLLKGIDNWIYSAKSEWRYQMREGKWIKDKTIFRGQWGIDQDDYGRLYYNHNSAILQGDQWQPSYLPALAATFSESIQKSYGVDMVSTKVYPRVASPVNRGYEENVVNAKTGKLISATGACGLSVYGGGQFPLAYKGNVFSPEPCGLLVKRVVLQDSLNFVIAKNPYEGKEFLTSTDQRFRPVFTTIGSDGALYIVDMHRGLIQHSTYLTTYLRNIISKEQLDKPIHLGRIYRVKHKDGTKYSAINQSISPDDLMKALSNDNKYQRIQAQWQLCFHKDLNNLLHKLHDLIAASHSDLAKLHAAWILDYAHDVRQEDIHILIKSSNKELQKLGLHLSSYLKHEEHQKIKFINTEANRLIYLSASTKYLVDNNDAVKDKFIQLCKKHHTDSSACAVLAGGVIKYASPARQQHLISALLKNGFDKKNLLIKNLNYKKTESKNLLHLAHFSKLEREMYVDGERNFKKYCASCHGLEGKGIKQLAPPLLGSEWVTHDDIQIPTSILLNGMSGPISIAGTKYTFNSAMPGLRDNQTINNGTIAQILTFIRNSWGNKAKPIFTEDVAKVRANPAIKLPSSLPIKKAIQENKPINFKKLSGANKEKLFNGVDLSNWHIRGGNATYAVKDMTIIGTSTLHTPNTFLVSNKVYADFEMEVDVWVDSLLNSGIQIRSNSYSNYNNNAFHGYQIEIDPSSRAWSGGLYDENRRGWLYKLEGKPKAQSAFKKNSWNRYKIRAVGDHLMTWINGIPIMNYFDGRTKSGYIGLQVHSIGDDASKNNTQVKWKNFRFKNLGNIIWMPSAEDEKNILQHAYDNNLESSWFGEKLNLDFQKIQRPKLNLVANFPLQAQYSIDSNNWKVMTIENKKSVLPKCRYLELSKLNETMRIDELEIR